MGRKGHYRELREREQIVWYQWEFLRRNLGYRKDYDAFMAQFGDFFHEKGIWYDQTVDYRDRDWDFFCDRICPRALEVCLKWQVADLFPPDWTFSKVSGLHAYDPRNPGKLYEPDMLDRVLEQASREKVSRRVGDLELYKCLPTGESRESIIASWSPPRGTFEEFVEEQRRSLVLKKKTSARPVSREELYRFVPYRFDVTQPLHEQLEAAKKRFGLARRRYENVFGKGRTPKSKKRRRLDLYDAYLRVWDLRLRGRPFAEIAEEVYPNEAGSQQRVWEHYQRAKALIEGEYKKLG